MNFSPDDRTTLLRIEKKLDLLLDFLAKLIPPQNPSGLSPAVQSLARDPNNKIAAIAQYRQETGASLADAKAVIERFMATGQ
jgi:hypothetical protein